MDKVKMDGTYHGEGDKLKVFVQGAPLEMHRMVCDVLCEEGFDARWDEEEKGFLEADVYFLVGDARQLFRIEKYIRAKGRRPLTILWQIDPMPAAGLVEDIYKIGLKVGRLDWRKIAGRGMGSIVQRYVPFAREILRLVRGKLLRRIDQLLIDGGLGEYAGKDYHREWERVMVRYSEFMEYYRKGWIDFVFATTKAKAEFFAGRGIEAEFVPFGYHPLFGRDSRRERDIDVVFLGRLNDLRRKKVVEKLGVELSKRKIGFKVAEENCFGDERAELLSRAKISLNLPRVPWDFAIERFIMSMACGAMVVSEIADNTYPFIEGTHYVSAEMEKLGEVIERYIRDEERRREIAQAGFNFVTERFALCESVRRIVQKCGLGQKRVG